MIKLRPSNHVDMDIVIDKITSDHVDRDVGIDKITSDQFMLTGMLVLIKLQTINSC